MTDGMERAVDMIRTMVRQRYNVYLNEPICFDIVKALAALPLVGVEREGPLPVAEREWQPIETAPLDDSEIWISNGKTVWLGTAHKDGSLKLPSRSECKFWMPAHKPAPPLLAEQGEKS